MIRDESAQNSDGGADDDVFFVVPLVFFFFFFHAVHQPQSLHFPFLFLFLLFELGLTKSCMRLMATNVAHPNGISVSVKFPNLLDARERGRLGTPKHHAAVRPAHQSARTVHPENAVDEWPEGKERRPLEMSCGFLWRRC